jgi:hypothetical protein
MGRRKWIACAIGNPLQKFPDPRAENRDLKINGNCE